MIKAVHFVTLCAKMSPKVSMMFALLLLVHCTLGMSGNGGGEGSERMETVSKQCREENHLKPEEHEDLRLMKYIETTDMRLKCFIKCMLTGLNFMSEEGELTLDDIPENMKKHESSFHMCRNVTGTDLCEKALNFHNCVSKQKTDA